MSKRKKKSPVKGSSEGAGLSKEAKRKLRDLIIIIAVTVILLGVYYYFVQIWLFKEAFIVALAVWSAAFIGYWVYNRGFTRKNVTPDMLPDDWSEERKNEFIEDGKRRLERSRWLIYVIVPLCFVFMAEIFMAIFRDSIYGFFNK